jgi:DnaK suppressor protein
MALFGDDEKPTGASEKESGGNGELPGPELGGTPARTYLNATELEEFRELLLTKRQELIRDVTNLESEAMRQSSGGGATSSMPIHMADLGSDTWEQELTLGLIENERILLREIDEALDRIDTRTFGMCLATNKRISKSRLRAKPWAKYCIEYARKRELGLA